MVLHYDDLCTVLLFLSHWVNYFLFFHHQLYAAGETCITGNTHILVSCNNELYPLLTYCAISFLLFAVHQLDFGEVINEESERLPKRNGNKCDELCTISNIMTFFTWCGFVLFVGKRRVTD